MNIISKLSMVGFASFLLLASMVAASGQGTAVPSAAMTKDQALKELRKSLEKNSRYQVQDIIINFKAMDFKTCNISYTFERPTAIGGDNFGRATVDPASPGSVAVRNSSSSSQTTSSVTGNSAGMMSDNNPSLTNRESSFFNTQKVTTMNLADIDLASIAPASNTKGSFITMKTIQNRRSIVRSARGNGSDPATLSGEALPLVNEKKFETLKQAFTDAITVCQAAN